MQIGTTKILSPAVSASGVTLQVPSSDPKPQKDSHQAEKMLAQLAKFWLQVSDQEKLDPVVANELETKLLEIAKLNRR